MVIQAAIYCRVSTDDQEKEGTSLQTQMQACLKYCQEKAYQVVHRFSEAYSGLTLDRSKLTELRSLVRAGEIDVIVVYCLDRLSRNATHGVVLRDELDKHHVILESVTEDIDKSPLGEAITYLRGTFAQIEAEKIKERTMRGKYAHLKEGKLPQGTGIGIYGYRWDKEAHRRVINEAEAKVVQKIFNMAIEGISTNRIAIALNKANVKTKSGSLWYPLTIRRILNNETYTGKTYFGQTKRVGNKVIAQPKESWILLPDVTPPVITDDIFNKAQEAMNKAKESRPVKEKAAYLLTGFIRCSKCGSTIGGTTMGGKYRYYKCRGANSTATRGKICDAGYIRADHIENFVWEHIRKTMRDPERVLQALDNIFNKDAESILKEQKEVSVSEKRDDFASAKTLSEVETESKELRERVTGKLSQERLFKSIDAQMSQLKKSLKFYPNRIRKCHEILSNEDEYVDSLLDVINKLKRNQERDKRKLKQLQELLEKISKAKQLRIKFTDCCRAVRDALSADINIDKKREVLRLLGTSVLARPGHYTLTTGLSADIEAYDKLVQSSLTDKNLVTIEQTSA